MNLYKFKYDHGNGDLSYIAVLSQNGTEAYKAIALKLGIVAHDPLLNLDSPPEKVVDNLIVYDYYHEPTWKVFL